MSYSGQLNDRRQNSGKHSFHMARPTGVSENDLKFTKWAISMHGREDELELQ